MRPPRRERGRYASLSGLQIVRGQDGDPFPLVVVDRDGLPVPHLTEYYRVRYAEQGPHNNTAATYLGHLLPVAGFFLERGWDWRDPPKVVREHLKAFFTERLHCKAEPDKDLDGFLLTPRAGTPLSLSSLRGVWSALRDLYRVMVDEGYYPHDQNPLESRLLTDLRKLRARTIRNRGAPDHAGIRGESRAESGRQPTAFFRSKHASKWQVDWHLALPDVMLGLDRAVDRMLGDPRLSLRDRCVLGLLRNTGARASEIAGMTVRGYRSFTRRVIAGEAVVKNKGSFGVEVKTIYFHAAYELQDLLARYVRTERARLDPAGGGALADLPGDAPLFLTERGTPYNYEAFKWQWRRIYPEARKLCPVDFSPHDLRHLLVTELLVKARATYGKDSPEYADSKADIAELFGWANPATIDVYDHSLNHIDKLGLLDDLQRSIAARSTRPTRQSPLPSPRERSFVTWHSHPQAPVDVVDALPDEHEPTENGVGVNPDHVDVSGEVIPNAAALIDAVDDIEWVRRRTQQS